MSYPWEEVVGKVWLLKPFTVSSEDVEIATLTPPTVESTLMESKYFAVTKWSFFFPQGTIQYFCFFLYWNRIFFQHVYEIEFVWRIKCFWKRHRGIPENYKKKNTVNISDINQMNSCQELNPRFSILYWFQVKGPHFPLTLNFLPGISLPHRLPDSHRSTHTTFE